MLGLALHGVVVHGQDLLVVILPCDGVGNFVNIYQLVNQNQHTGVARLLQEAGKQLQIFIPVVVRDDHMDPQLLPRFGLGAVFAPEPLEDLGLGLVITGDVGLIIQGQQPCKVEAVNHFIQGVDDGGNPLLHQAWQLRRRDAQIFRSHHLLLDIADPAV